MKRLPFFYAILAAVCYGISAPVAKILLKDMPPAFMASMLYLGAGFGMVAVNYFRKRQSNEKEAQITKKELPYTVAMVGLDIAAPIFLMFGLTMTTSATVSLLNNFEIVATAIIALAAFKEAVGKEKVLEKILDGSKTMIVRGAAGRKIPHSRVFENEILYFMKKGTAKISAKATVESVQNLVKLSEDEIISALEEQRLALSAKQKERWHKKCLCLVGFKDVAPIAPLDFDHQGNMDDWLIVEKIEDVVVGTSIPYNYEKSRF